MKIAKKQFNSIDLYGLGIILFFLLVNKFFYIFKLPTAYGAGQQTLSAVFAIILFSFMVLIQHKLRVDQYSKWILGLFLFIAIEFLYSVFHYENESLMTMLKDNLYFFVLFIYFVVDYWISSKEKFEIFITLITWICLITNILLISNAFIYNLSGNFILQIGGINYGDTIKILYRSNGIRIYNVNQGLIFIVAIISAGYVFGDKGKQRRFIHLLNILTTLFSLYYIEQSRMALLIISIAIMAVLLLSNNSNRQKKYILILMVLALGIVFGIDIITGTATSIWDSLTNSSDKTSLYRFQEMTYYWQCALKQPFFGLGFVSPSGNNASIVSGYAGNWSYTDIGLIGIMGKMGITGAIFYLFMLFKLMKAALTIKTSTRGARIGICIALFLGLATLSYFDSQRIMGLVIAIIYIHETNIYDRAV